MTKNLATLTDEYGEYLTRHGLPEMSADELLFTLFDYPETADTLQHQRYLSDFINRWDAAEKAQRNCTENKPRRTFAIGTHRNGNTTALLIK